MRKSDPRQYIALITVGILALLVGVAILIQKEEEQGKPPLPKPRPPQLHKIQPPIVKHAFPDLLIKGCLFNLGFTRHDVRFLGRTVKVAMHRPLTADEISRAFAPIDEIGRIQIEDERHVRIVIDGTSWEIFFSRISGKTAARCAIIIDDMGPLMETAEILSRIDADLTFAVLPNTPDTQKVARFLHRRGKEILLHLPMQGNGKDPGPGAILQGMTSPQISEILKQDLECVPYITGVNNHMGSVITTDREAMRLIMDELKRKGLFFVDSLTTSKSVCSEVAHDLKVPFIVRDVFLDNELDPSYITSQMEKLVRISLKYSNAVGICHPHPETIAVLEREIPKMKGRGVEIVKVSALISSSGVVERGK